MPANLVNLEAVGKSYATTVLLAGVSLGVAEADRVGVVGRNGGGKSTLVRLLAGVEPPDEGRVTHVGGLRVGLLAQQDVLPATGSVRQAVVGEAAEHVWAGDPRVREVLSGLLGGVDLEAPVGPLSGGERRRVALAALLARDLDLVVLDEPTNHLDVEAVDWLARHLTGRGGALVVVTHDRWFLDAVCTQTWEVADGEVRRYDGGYAAYVLARAERERLAAAAEERRQQLLRKELAWLRRGPPARTSKPRFRIEAANALIADEPPARDAVALQRFATARLGKDVYDVEDVTLDVGGRRLLDRVTWRLGPGDRVAVVGVNGSGKTSLLRLLAGQLAPGGGRVRVGRTVRPAYLAQEVGELPPGHRVREVVEQVALRLDVGAGRELTAVQLLDRFGFAGARQRAPVGDLSGGERRRLQLMRLLMAGPNVLLLDEPTNDLDVEVLRSLEDLLDGWPGTLVVVSHDRYFVERTTDAVFALTGDGALRHLPGGVEEYLRLRRSAPAPGTTPGRRRAGDTRAARKELARIERRLQRVGAQESRLQAELAAHATDYERVAALDRDLRALAAERAELEESWLALSYGEASYEDAG